MAAPGASDEAAPFKAAFDSSPVPTWVNRGGRLAYVNPACVALFGVRSEADLLGRSPYDLIHSDFHDQVRRRIEVALGGDAPLPATEERIVRADGSLVDVEVTAWPVAFGGRKALQVTMRDISRQKQTESELRAGERQVREILDSLFTFVGVLSPDGVLLQANRAPLEAAGITEEDVVGVPFADTYWWSWSPEVQNPLRAAIKLAAAGHTVRYDVAVRMRADTRMTIDFMLSPLRDAEGAVTRLVASGVDVTARVEAARALGESERRFRATFENAAVGIAEVSPEGRWLAVNERLCEILGYTREEVLSRTFQDITWHEDLARDLELAAELAAGSIPFYTMEKRYVRRDGSLVWANLTVGSVRDEAGRILYYISVIEDIRQRKESQEALRRSEADLKALADSVPQLVWMADPDGWIYWYNRRWYEYTGTTPEQMEGWGWQSVHDPDELPRVLQAWRHSIATGEAFSLVFPLRAADGTFRPFLTRIIPVRDGGGRLLRWVGTNTDISDQRATENALRAANAELQQFAYVAAHDMQEPLRMVHVYSELLVRRSAAEEQPALRELATYVQTGVRRIERLIRDLLGYSKVLHTEGEVELEPVDLNLVMAEVLSVFQDQIDNTNAAVLVAPLPAVRGEVGRLTQVFQNLIGNALKYHRPGQRPVLEISSRHSNGECVIEVADQGIGFDPQYSERIFGLFKRLHREDYPGTGLGLAICRRIVTALGGRIWAESRPGQGARFYVALQPAEASSTRE